jgi:hypothetical protein
MAASSADAVQDWLSAFVSLSVAISPNVASLSPRQAPVAQSVLVRVSNKVIVSF